MVTAVALAVSLHGVLLLARGAAIPSATAGSHSVAIRFIESRAGDTAPSVVEPAPPTATATASPRSRVGPSAAGEVARPSDARTARPARRSPATENVLVPASEQSVTPIVPASAEPSVPPPAHVLPDAPDYLLGKLLSVGPRPLDDIQPQYPDGADLRSGKVVLRLLIGDTGHVDDVAVVRATPPGVFDASAVEAFSKARFAPGLAAGVAVKSQLMVEVEFVPLTRLSRISGRSY